MSRTAMNILTVILIIALAIWAIYTYKACQESKTLATDDTAEVTDDSLEDPDSLSLEDLYENTEEDDSTAESDLGSNGDNGTDPVNEEPIEEEEEPIDNDLNSGTSDYGDFLIIVGAFLSRESAERVVNRLNQLGYNAERRVFLSSDYHSVIVGNYEDLNEAYRATKKIKDAGYPDAYAHKKRLPKKRR